MAIPNRLYFSYSGSGQIYTWGLARICPCNG